MLAILIFLIAMIAYGFGEYTSKLFSLNPSIKLVILTILLYIVPNICWFPLILWFKKLTIIGSLWNLGYVLITLFVGFFIFHEVVTTIQMIGIILAIIATGLILFG